MVKLGCLQKLVIIKQSINMEKEKHPYYDSDRKKKTQGHALKMIAWSFIAMVILAGLSLIFS